IDWGDGTRDVLTPDLGARTFSGSHRYLDDDPSGTPADDYPIKVTVTDDDGGTGSSVVTVTVNNVAPVVTSLTPASAVNEDDTYTLAGTFHDPGTLDTHAVVIAWGPGEGATALGNADLTYLGNGDWSFTASHQYLDDNPSGTPSDVYNISVSVTDDDTG